MRSFIRVVEVWVPAADGAVLTLADGLFDDAPEFGALSRTMTFGRGEGLPGHAWHEGRPVMLRQFDDLHFRRAEAARAARLTCALAVPIFWAQRLTSVIVLLCGDPEELVGAIELWRNDPRVSGDLSLSDGYFGRSAHELEELTRDGGLARGAGAPGLAWQREAAVFIDNVGAAAPFLRAQVASAAGVVRAVAIPCSVRARETWVLSLLSSNSTPLVRRFESWLPNETGSHLQRASGFCEVHGRLAADDMTVALSAEALGPIGQAWRHGTAGVIAGDAMRGKWLSGDRQLNDLRAVLAIPVIDDDTVSEVVALYF